MSRMLTISFVEAMTAHAHRLADIGRPVQALKKLAAVLSDEELSPTIANQAHRLAATLNSECDNFATARRHLRTVARLHPTDAGIRYELGLAFQNDPFGCDARAARQFRTAVTLDPTNATYVAALGLAQIRINRVKMGKRNLVRAARMAPTDRVVLETVIAGLIEAEMPKLACRILNEARFTNPEMAGLDRLSDRVRFATAVLQQERDGRGAGRTPTVVPFVRVVSTNGTHTRDGIIRRDLGSFGGPHIGRIRAFRAEQG